MNYVLAHEHPKGPTYPRLMRGTRGTRDIVVLFITRTYGMRLTETGLFPPDEGWVPADDVAEWEPFYGTITVSA